RRHTRCYRDWSSDVCSSDLLDTIKLADGYHELRIVGSRSDPIETQGRKIVPVLVNNHSAAVELKLSSPMRVGKAGKLKLSVRQRSEERRVGKECRSRGEAEA